MTTGCCIRESAASIWRTVVSIPITVEHTFRFSDTTVLGATTVNEARLGVTFDKC